MNKLSGCSSSSALTELSNKLWHNRNENICEIMGFVVILYETKMKNVSVPKISEFAPIDGEILASLCSDNCMQILQKLILEDLYGVSNNYLCARIRYKQQVWE